MTSKKVSFTIPSRAFKNLKAAMKKMGFSTNSLFLRYCVLNTIKANASADEKRIIEKEMKMIKDKEK